jgi:hypothetical protein
MCMMFKNISLFDREITFADAIERILHWLAVAALFLSSSHLVLDPASTKAVY